MVLALTRTRPDYDLKVEAISKNRGTAGDPASLRVRLQNTTSATRDVYLPLIARLDRIDASGSAPVEIGSPPYTLSYTLSDGTVPSQLLRIAADAGLDLDVTVQGLADPGSYKGTMRFTAPDRKPLDAPFELALRLGWVWAGSAIAFGVLVAAGLRYFQQTGQPRLLVQRDALGLRSKLATFVQAESGDLIERERDAVAFLMEQIDTASDQLADSNTQIATPVAILETIRSKLELLPDWIKFRRRRDAISPPSVGAAIDPDLDTVFDTLMTEQASAQRIDDAKTLLAGMDSRLKEALKKHILAETSELRTAIGELAPAEQLAFSRALTILATVEIAANELRLDAARAALDEARSTYAEIGARLLRPKLNAAAPAVGFSPAEWTTFVAEITSLLNDVVVEPNPERRIERWNEADRRYVVEVVRRAKERIDFHVAATNPGPEDMLKTAAVELAKAEAEIAAGHFAAARKAYDAAMVAVDQARPLITVAGRRSGTAQGADLAAPGGAAGLPPSIIDTAVGSVLPLPLGRGVSIVDVESALRRYSLIFTGVILALAVLTGLQLLYVPDPAFGWRQLPIAFLWGAGLHAVAGQAFQGLQGLAQQFR